LTDPSRTDRSARRSVSSSLIEEELYGSRANNNRRSDWKKGSAFSQELMTVSKPISYSEQLRRAPNGTQISNWNRRTTVNDDCNVSEDDKYNGRKASSMYLEVHRASRVEQPDHIIFSEKHDASYAGLQNRLLKKPKAAAKVIPLTSDLKKEQFTEKLCTISMKASPTGAAQLYLGETNGPEPTPITLPRSPMSVENTLEEQPSEHMSFVLSIADRFPGNSERVARFLQAQHEALERIKNGGGPSPRPISGADVVVVSTRYIFMWFDTLVFVSVYVCYECAMLWNCQVHNFSLLTVLPSSYLVLFGCHRLKLYALGHAGMACVFEKNSRYVRQALNTHYWNSAVNVTMLQRRFKRRTGTKAPPRGPRSRHKQLSSGPLERNPKKNSNEIGEKYEQRINRSSIHTMKLWTGFINV